MTTLQHIPRDAYRPHLSRRLVAIFVIAALAIGVLVAALTIPSGESTTPQATPVVGAVQAGPLYETDAKYDLVHGFAAGPRSETSPNYWVTHNQP